MDRSDPNIKFDERGVCERCGDYYAYILPMWNKGENKQTELNAIVDKIKKTGKGRQYDCILGLSGGFDSSYMLHFAVKELKLRPLVFHVDAGWDTQFAEENIKKMIAKLGVELKTEVINWNEIRDFQVAFFKSGVPHLDTPQDHAFVAVLDKYAEKNKIKYILNGGNISTEVIVNPNDWGYWGTDMAQIRDILKQFGTVKMKTFPFTNVIKRKVIVPYIKGVKVVKLLNYIPYIKKDAEKILMDEYGYVPYEQKHFEDILTKFIEGYWLAKRFGYDVRRPQFSSLILTGQMTRDEAIEKLKNPAISEQEAALLFEQIAKKLEISTDELKRYFMMPLKTYKDYKNQESLFALGAKIMYWLKLDKLIRK
jgi:N-acetyl sugar amidotransferase